MNDELGNRSETTTNKSSFAWFWNSNKEEKSDGEEPVSDTFSKMGQSLVISEGTHRKKRESSSLCTKRDIGRDWDFAGIVTNGRSAACRNRIQTESEDEKSKGWGEKSETIFLFPEERKVCDPFEGTHQFQMGFNERMSETSETRTSRSRDYTTGFVVGGLVSFGVISLTFLIFPCN